MQAHSTSDVVMDIAAFKVSHSVDCDIDATASMVTTLLRAARARSSSIGAMEEMYRHARAECEHTLVALIEYTCQFKGLRGALEEISRSVQRESTPRKPYSHTRWC